MYGLVGGSRESSRGSRKGIGGEVGAVEELRRVGRDVVVVVGPLPVRDQVRRGGGGSRGKGKIREGGERIAEGGRGGCGSGLALDGEVDALQRENGQI